MERAVIYSCFEIFALYAWRYFGIFYNFADKKASVKVVMEGLYYKELLGIRSFAYTCCMLLGQRGGGSSINTRGHVFLTVTNTPGSDTTVGRLNIGLDSGLTMGTWGNKSDYTGLWYHLEGTLAYHQDAYSNCISMRVSLTDNLLSTVSSNIKNGIS